MVDTEQRTAQILQTCLEAIESDRETVDSVLLRYPELEDELRPQLENAAWLITRRSLLDPDAAFLARSRQRLMTRIAAQAAPGALGAPVVSPNGHKPQRTSWLSAFRLPAVVVRAGVALMVVVGLFIGAERLVETTATTIPGDSGYTVKRTVENLTLAVSQDPGQQIVLYLEFSERRLSETNALVDKARYDEANQTLNEFQNQVKNAVVSLNQVQDQDTVHKELLAMTIEETLSDHTRELSSLLPKVPEETRPEVSRALAVSNTGVNVAQTAIKRLMTMRTPQPGELPPGAPTPLGGFLPTELAPTPTEAQIFQVFSTPTAEFRQIFSATEAPVRPTRPANIRIPTLPPVGPTSTPLPTSTPDVPTPIPTEAEVTDPPSPEPGGGTQIITTPMPESSTVQQSGTP